MASILVIDDEPAFRQAIARVLGEAGHDIFVARDGREGLRLLRILRPDIVLTDIFMPNVDGIEILLANRGLARPSRLIAMSEVNRLGGFQYLNIVLELGAELVLEKPIRWHELHAAIARLSAGEAPMGRGAGVGTT
jgi:two-component system chemotaxis response regulator CheY